MMKLLHSADWHLDAPMVGKDEAQAAFLRAQLRKVPEKVAKLCKQEDCRLLLLSGDLFDGEYTKESYRAVYDALKELDVPVFIAPGNHDFCRPGSPYLEEAWPENVHIFTKPVMESVPLPELNCVIYGAGYQAMDCPPLLKDFHAEGEGLNIGILHGDATVASSPYCPITSRQFRESGLHYLALGHIHKEGRLRSDERLCAWPGCPMGKDFGQDGIKGALVVTFDTDVRADFVPLDTPRFFDLETDVGEDPLSAAAALVPAGHTDDFYRITLTGYSSNTDTAAIAAALSHVPHLTLRDRTMPEVDLWSAVGEDTLEGVLFRILQEGLDTEVPQLQKQVKLAARISRQILDGQEVTLP